MVDERILFHGALEEVKYPTDDRTTSKSTQLSITPSSEIW